MTQKTSPKNRNKAFGRRKDLHRIIIAKGDNVTRSVTVHPLLAAAGIGLTLTFAVGYLGATAYLMFRDDLLNASHVRQVRIQNAYEDQLASLRIEIDRITSRQMLDQQSVEHKLDKLLGLRASIERRQRAVSNLTQTANAAGLNIPSFATPLPRPHPARTEHAALPELKSIDAIQTASIGQPNAFASVQLSTPTTQLRIKGGAVDLKRIEQTLISEEVNQVHQLRLMAQKTVQSSRQIASVIRSLGYKAPLAAPNSVEEAVGGPFVEASDLDPIAFDNSVLAIEENLNHLRVLKKQVRRFPILKPLKNGKITSRFGRRVDPFLGRYAHHSGMDFKAPTGAPVHVTGPGKVVKAGWHGGYGRLVEVQHAGGIKTRYAHLSKISVKEGSHIAAGTVVGRVGSSGRSTGPHLHYETRISNKPVNPVRFINAGTKVKSVL